MGKVDENKKKKKEALFNTAYELFTTKGTNQTTISDIVNKAGVAKGTFYLYFKDKYDIRNKLVSHKTSELFYQAYRAIIEQEITGFRSQLHFMIDFILDALQKDSSLLVFISRNLSWGVFQTALEDQIPDEDRIFYEAYLELLEKDEYTYDHPDMLLFSVIELASSTCYSCILYQQPVSLDEYLPYLHRSIDGILDSYTHKEAEL